MIKVGIVGVGFMGWIHWLAYQRLRGVKVAAICTRDPKKQSGDWRKIKGNFGPAGEQVDLAGVSVYSTVDELLADESIDLVDICLPPDMHADVTVAAAKAGKHVFCEKPIALSTAECKRMVAAMEKAGKLLHIGHVLPFGPQYAFALDAIQSGKYGRALGGHFRRVISDPLWLPDFYNPQKVGGPALDLHVHDAHFIRVAFGMPEGVTSQGRMRGEVVEYFNTFFQYPDPTLTVSATSGVINQQGRPFTHSFEIHLERATLLYDLAVIGSAGEELMPLTVLDERGKVTRPKLKAGDEIAGFVGEIKEVVAAINSGQPSALLGGDLARDAVILCHKQTESVLKGRRVKV